MIRSVNTSNLIMALLFGSAGCSIASLTSEKYFVLGTGEQYGIFQGKNGGSGCLGQCQSDSEKVCVKDESVCALFKAFPIIVGLCSFAAIILLTFTFTDRVLTLNKEIAAWVLMWIAFVVSIANILVQLLVPVIDNKSLWDLHESGKVSWSEGFTLSVITIVTIGVAAILHGIKNISLFEKKQIEPVVEPKKNKIS